LKVQHLRELSLARYGGHFCPFRAKNGKSRSIFLRNFKFLRLCRKNLGLSHLNATAPFFVCKRCFFEDFGKRMQEFYKKN